MASPYEEFLKKIGRKKRAVLGLNDPHNPFYTIARTLHQTQQVVEAFKNDRIQVIITPVFGEGGFLQPIGANLLGIETVREGQVPRRGQYIRKSGKGAFTIDDYISGLTAYRDFLLSGEIDIIAKANYDITVRALLKRKLSELSLSRGGGGAGAYISAKQKQVIEGGRTKTVKELVFARRNPSELSDKWHAIEKLIDVPLKSINLGNINTYVGFDMQQILSVKMDSSRSRFTSVYKMVEFGTGQLASPGPRRYTSLNSTPFKVSPSVAALFGGDTSWWFSDLRSVAFANTILKGYAKADRKGKSYTYKANPLSFAHGGKDAIPPSKIIFDNRGMARDLRLAYIEFYRRLIQDINEGIQAVVPFWPNNAINVNTLHFPATIIDPSLILNSQ